MKLLLENLPPSLAPQRETLRRCLEAMNAALPIQQVILLLESEARPLCEALAEFCLGTIFA